MPHIHEKIDFTVSTYIVNGNAVLLREHEKYSVWLPPGGHIELDEDPVQAAIREAKEETGLDITLMPNGKNPTIKDGWNENLLTPPHFMNRHLVGDSAHTHVDLTYMATTDSRELHPEDDEDSVRMHWFTKEELDDPQYRLKDVVKYYAKAALDAAAKK